MDENEVLAAPVGALALMQVEALVPILGQAARVPLGRLPRSGAAVLLDELRLLPVPAHEARAHGHGVAEAAGDFRAPKDAAAPHVNLDVGNTARGRLDLKVPPELREEHADVRHVVVLQGRVEGVDEQRGRLVLHRSFLVAAEQEHVLLRGVINEGRRGDKAKGAVVAVGAHQCPPRTDKVLDLARHHVLDLGGGGPRGSRDWGGPRGSSREDAVGGHHGKRAVQGEAQDLVQGHVRAHHGELGVGALGHGARNLGALPHGVLELEALLLGEFPHGALRLRFGALELLRELIALRLRELCHLGHGDLGLGAFGLGALRFDKHGLAELGNGEGELGEVARDCADALTAAQRRGGRGHGVLGVHVARVGEGHRHHHGDVERGVVQADDARPRKLGARGRGHGGLLALGGFGHVGGGTLRHVHTIVIVVVVLRRRRRLGLHNVDVVIIIVAHKVGAGGYRRSS